MLSSLASFASPLALPENNASFNVELPDQPRGGSRSQLVAQSAVEYNHREEMSNLEDINKTLVELRDELLHHQVRCHVLGVDLAMLHSPRTVSLLRDAVPTGCSRCQTSVPPPTTQTTHSRNGTEAGKDVADMDVDEPAAIAD